MKKLTACLLAAFLAASAAGCAKEQPANTALQYMEKYNKGAVPAADAFNRLWYEIDPYMWTDIKDEQQSTFISLSAILPWLSDGSIQTDDDLNISGLFLSHAALQTKINPSDPYAGLDPTLGTEEEFKSFCQQAASLSIPVMIEMDLTQILDVPGWLEQLTDAVKGLQPDQNLDAVDENLRTLFYLVKDPENTEGMSRIADTAYWYRTDAGTTNPLVNYNNPIFQDACTQAVDYWTGLGVNAFYINEYQLMHADSLQACTDFINWFNQITAERSPMAYVVVRTDSWADEMSQAGPALAATDWMGTNGMIAKAVTGAASAQELGEYLQNQVNSNARNAYMIEHQDLNLDLLKTKAKLPQYKMALALNLMMNQQVFLMAGDELGMTSDKANQLEGVIAKWSAASEEESDEQLESISQLNLDFGDIEEQSENGDSILNFVRQTLWLRDAYSSVTGGRLTYLADLSTPQVLALDKVTDTSHTVLVFNLCDEVQTFDASSIQISGLPAEVGGALLTGDQDIGVDGAKITMPPYSMVLLK